jgi:hypothetical protein
MLPKLSLLAALTMLEAILAATASSAQTPAPSASVQSDSGEPDPLPGLPRPLDAPRSLFQESPPTPPYTCAPLPGPYFENDPRLDPPWLPQHPGWFAAVDLDIVGPHVKNRLTDMVQVGTRAPDTVSLGSANLDWTAAVRSEVGYRLPSGFGAVSVAYKYLATEGSGTVAGPDGIESLKSRLDVTVADLNYSSREWSLWPHWGMKWTFGLRLASIYFDSNASEPFAVAAAGCGIFDTHVSNHYLGGGPHLGLELTRSWQDPGLSFIVRTDAATLLGRVHQHFAEESTLTGPGGQLLCGQSTRSNPQSVPEVNAFLGIGWQPPSYPYFNIAVGYEYEYWWNVGRLSTGSSRGEWSEQGISMRAGFNF